MTKKPIAPEMRRLLRQVTGRRARIVADHIAEHGSITTDELRDRYGYAHPPRAKQDLQEQGIPIETVFVKNAQGRRIAAYRFGDLNAIKKGRFRGRRAFPKGLKESLLETSGAKCAICSTELDPRYLQTDHRVPYIIAGEPDASDLGTTDFQLLCTSCNRAKSWSCEHCPNWAQGKKPSVCLVCYWASPASYDHVATMDIRRLDLSWKGAETSVYDRLVQAAEARSLPLPNFVKATLARAVGERKT